MSRVQSFIQQPHRDANKRRQVQQERSMHSVEKNLSSSFKHKTKDRNLSNRQVIEPHFGDRLWASPAGAMKGRLRVVGRTRYQSHKTNYFGTHLRQVSLFPRFLLAALLSVINLKRISTENGSRV